MIFDIEGDGLTPTKIHCLSYEKGGKIRTVYKYGEMRKVLASTKLLIGHNIIRYDVPVLERILNIKIEAKLIDTLTLSWYLFPNRLRHGLEFWGEDFGVPKPVVTDWEGLTPEEYAHRCEEDVKINGKVWKACKEKLLELYGSKKKYDRCINYLMYKMDCAVEQERSRWKLDVDLATRSRDTLLQQQEEKIEQLKSVLPSVVKTVVKTKPAKPFKKDGTWSVTGAKWFALLSSKGLPEDYEGGVEVEGSVEEPNPNSPDQIKKWLTSLGWEPETFKYVKDNKTGLERSIPQVRKDNDGVKELCPSVIKLAEKQPEVRLLEGLSVIQHRLSIFKGFLENQEDGWVKAEINGLTNTLRFKHKVVVNLPGVDKPWGEEVRGCLVAPEGHILCGSDMTSLEETTKKHYMWEYDPDFVTEMSRENFDAHLDLAKYAGVVTQEEIDDYTSGKKGCKNLKPIRKNYKAANYACIYGVGAPKLARETGLSVSEAKKLIETYWKRNWSVKKLSEDMFVKHVGGEMWLYNPVSELYYSLRNLKDIFSTLNQGTGVFCFDSWIREFRKKRSQLTAQFHDEIVSCLKEGQEDRYSKLLKDSIKSVNDKLKLNVKLDVDIQFGKTYADIH